VRVICAQDRLLAVAGLGNVTKTSARSGLYAEVACAGDENAPPRPVGSGRERWPLALKPDFDTAGRHSPSATASPILTV